MAIVANVVHSLSFAFLIILSQLVRYDWRLDDVAMVFGATPVRCFFKITLPVIWPAILGAFLVSFILAFNDLELSFYTLGAIPTIPTATWGALRFKFAPELFSLASLINAFVFSVFVILFLLIRTGLLRLGPPEK